MKRSTKKHAAPELPPASDWRTSDQDEILKRRIRAREETFRIENLDTAESIFSNFEIHSASGMSYRAEIRDIAAAQYSCTCTDFRINGLGTCKHIEALLLQLARRQRAAFAAAKRLPSPRIDLVPHAESNRLRIERNLDKLPARIRCLFDSEGFQISELDPESLYEKLLKNPAHGLRISQDTEAWLAHRARERDCVLTRRDYEIGVRNGRHPEQVTLHPLFPYQREGMLHLAFRERALLADEMGLGKTIQAIAACALLHSLGKARRILVVTPASLKTEWEEQIKKFTTLPLRLVFGGRSARAALYRDPDPAFFTIANYEQIVSDSLEINTHLRPDIVVLDEAQRIKNWPTKTAQAVKRLQSRYAFVLTGTPIENRIDELRSLVDFLDPALLGPLFRFNREYYELDERGRPSGYKNLARLRERVSPILLRRRKRDVETELPDRSDRNHFVRLTKPMQDEYDEHKATASRLVNKSKTRPLTPSEQDILMISLNCMRMVCDSPCLIKKNPSRDCPKLEELAGILDELLSDPDVKIIVFSEWTGMLEFVRDLAKKLGVHFAWHTGSVPQQRRRAEILAFRNDPACRLFLSTDSGGVGLNLQNASVVINCDLPWNPAKLEQRIARAWRKGQLRPVTVINLVAEHTIEHAMLGSLAAKTGLSEGVLDGADLANIKLKTGRDSLLKRLEQILAPTDSEKTAPPAPVTDPAAHFAKRAREALGMRLQHCEETWIPGQDTPLLLAVIDKIDPASTDKIQALHRENPWPGTSQPALQILDASTWDALKNLAAVGMITIQSRAARPLISAAGEPLRPPLTPEQLARIATLRALAAKKHRAAEALTSAGLPEEAEPLLAAAREAEAQALAIESGQA